MLGPALADQVAVGVIHPRATALLLVSVDVLFALSLPLHRIPVGVGFLRLTLSCSCAVIAPRPTLTALSAGAVSGVFHASALPVCGCFFVPPLLPLLAPIDYIVRALPISFRTCGFAIGFGFFCNGETGRAYRHRKSHRSTLDSKFHDLVSLPSFWFFRVLYALPINLSDVNTYRHVR